MHPPHKNPSPFRSRPHKKSNRAPSLLATRVTPWDQNPASRLLRTQIQQTDHPNREANRKHRRSACNSPPRARTARSCCAAYMNTLCHSPVANESRVDNRENPMKPWPVELPRRERPADQVFDRSESRPNKSSGWSQCESASFLAAACRSSPQPSCVPTPLESPCLPPHGPICPAHLA